VTACLDGTLRRDVTRGEQKPGRHAVRGGRTDAAAEQLNTQERRTCGRSDPEADGEIRGAGPLPVTSRERDPEQDEPGDGDRDADPLVPREWSVCDTRDHEREDPDAACRRRLNERQRCERQREHEERPPDRLDAESEEPAAAAEESPRGGDRTPDRERRHPPDGAVLEQVADVERARGGECGDKGERELHGKGSDGIVSPRVPRRRALPRQPPTRCSRRLPTQAASTRARMSR
jgi:hypothetical protein